MRFCFIVEVEDEYRRQSTPMVITRSLTLCSANVSLDERQGPECHVRMHEYE